MNYTPEQLSVYNENMVNIYIINCFLMIAVFLGVCALYIVFWFISYRKKGETITPDADEAKRNILIACVPEFALQTAAIWYIGSLSSQCLPDIKTHYVKFLTPVMIFFLFCILYIAVWQYWFIFKTRKYKPKKKKGKTKNKNIKKQKIKPQKIYSKKEKWIYTVICWGFVLIIQATCVFCSYRTMDSYLAKDGDIPYITYTGIVEHGSHTKFTDTYNLYDDNKTNVRSFKISGIPYYSKCYAKIVYGKNSKYVVDYDVYYEIPS